MSSTDYGSIPASSQGTADGDSGSSIFTILRWITAVAVVILVVDINSLIKMTPITDGTPNTVDNSEVVAVEPVVPPEWPPKLVQLGGAYEGFPYIPTTTEGVAAKGWARAEGEPCDPLLGEPWLIGGKRSQKTGATLYFAASNGVISGIGADYYGYMEKNQVGIYFGDEKTSPDGTYHSLSLALRDYEKEDLCDASKPLSTTKLEKLTLAPGLAALNIPLNQSDEELQTGWREGSCIPNMGYHWFKDMVGGPDITYEVSNLVPIVPMYTSTSGGINGIFFAGTSLKQSWPEQCVVEPNPAQPCAAPYLNMWDRAPGQNVENKPRFFMCNNFCDKNCAFTGSPDGKMDTMHWIFHDTLPNGAEPETCGNGRIYCRNGEYPDKAE